MKRSLLPLSLAVMGFGLWTSSSVSAQAPAAADEVVVQVKSGVKVESVADRVEGVELEEKVDGTNLALLSVDKEETSVKKAVADLSAQQNVVKVQPNYTYQPAALSNDPYRAYQWALHNTGQSVNGQAGLADVDMNLPEAWTLAEQKGAQEVVVAVLDTGTDLSHPDLQDHIWTNEPEANGQAGVDDDRNGYIDDIHGWDFYHNDNTVFDAADGDTHGTHVSGTIAAGIQNGTGTAGVAPNVEIMPLKILGPNGGDTVTAIKAIQYAKEQGVKIANNSWGGYGGANGDLLSSAIQSSGMLFVASAGNDGKNNDVTPAYPASYAAGNVLSVAAMDNRGQLASFSNYGQNTVDLAAPGVSILSTLPGGYGYANGTSMASPHVSGAAALLLGTYPSLTTEQMIAKIKSTGKALQSGGSKIGTSVYPDVQKLLQPEEQAAAVRVNDVWDSTPYVSGSAGSKARVTVTVAGSKVFVQDTDTNGNFKVKAGYWPPGTSIHIKAAAGTKMIGETSVQVQQDTAAPVIESAAATDASTVISGKINEEAKVQVQIGSSLYPRTPVSTDANGNFKLAGASMKAGSIIRLLVKDNAKAANSSQSDIVVEDKTAPLLQKVQPIYNTSHFIEGTVNEQARVTVFVTDSAGSVLDTFGEAASIDGKFILPLEQKLLTGTKLVMEAEDQAGNKSRAVKSVVLADRTTPKLLDPKALSLDDSGEQTVTGRLSEEGSVEIQGVASPVSTDKEGYFEVNLPQQAARAKLTFVLRDTAANKTVLYVTVKDVTSPVIKSIDPLYDTAKYATGTVSEASLVTAEVNGKIAATARTDNNGRFKLLVNRRTAGTELVVKAKDVANLSSEANKVTVLPDTAAPVLDTETLVLHDATTVLSGKINEEAKVTVKVNGSLITRTPALTDTNGAFKISIAKQRAGTEVMLSIVDYAGNETIETLTVQDRTAPVSIKVSPVYGSQSIVSGQFSEAVQITVYKVDARLTPIGSSIGSGSSESNGSYAVSLDEAQNPGTRLKIEAVDSAGLVSKPVYTIVR